MSRGSFVVNAASADLDPWPLESWQVVSGAPQVFGVVLDESPDGTVQRGVWEHAPGVSCDVEVDEMFMIVAGRATIEIEDGPVLEVRPGDVGVLRAGDRTVWRVHETLRKVYQARPPRPEADRRARMPRRVTPLAPPGPHDAPLPGPREGAPSERMGRCCCGGHSSGPSHSQRFAHGRGHERATNAPSIGEEGAIPPALRSWRR